MSKGNIDICEKPSGDQTTILDLCDRDNQDDFLFPLDTNTSWFARDSSRRVLPFTTVIQEFAYKGTGTWNGKIQFDIGMYKPCDLLFTVALQIKLDHWFTPLVVEKIKQKKWVFKNPNDVWFYANSLGTILVKEAELLVEDHTIEKVSGDFANVFSLVYPDINTSYGISSDAYGQVGIKQLLKQNITRMYPTEDGWITCLLPFSFQRERLRAAFPLLSVKESSMRIRLTLRPFSECVRNNSLNRANLDDTPLNKTFTFINTTYPYYQEETATTGPLPPDFKSIQLLTYGCILDGKYREALLHKPFDRIYRNVQTFNYDEPTKYTMVISGKDTVQVTLPLECNGPIEEILWFIRRKAVSGNNEWTNYTSVLEREYDPVFQPIGTLLVDATIQVDGVELIHGSEKFFRRNIGQRHKGGILSYLANIYGYNFCTKPGTHDPSGWFNASRANDVRIRMRIMPPGGIEDLEWEVVVFVVGINWIRFQSGLASKVFSS